jgi:tetratricopeptide (TPR) repeat protein
MIPETGERFGPYEILGRLGGGAMGVVFRAWDARLHREVAIKVLHDDYTMPGMRQRFLQEARAASALNHPNICTIFDLGEQNGEPYLVMELLEGETLKERISRGAVPADEIVAYSQEVADALAAAHAKGIVHRDIKPANIFLVDLPNGRKQAKVLDFGLAKIGLAMPGGVVSRQLDLTLAGATVGTLSYMSPEQARGQVLDARSDLFSLGVVMYEMATRQVPFKGATSALIFVQLLNHAPEPVHDWNDSIPKDLERVILKLLSKDPNDRYQSAEDLAKALRKIPFRSGGWLKRAASSVPLVRASDPVARAKRPVRPEPDAERPGLREKVTPAGAMPAAAVRRPRPALSGENTLIRPVARSLQREAGLRDEGVLRGDRTVSGRAVPDRAAGVAVSSSDQIEAAPQGLESPLGTADVVAGPEMKQAAEDVVPARSRSGATQFEFGVEGAEAEAIAAREKAAEQAAIDAGRWTKPKHEATDEEAAERRGKNIRIAVVACVLAVVAIAGFVLVNSGKFRPVLLLQGDPVLLTVIQNRTHNGTLDGSVMEGLEVMLDQTQYLTIRGGDAYGAALRQAQAEGGNVQVSNRRLAQMVGAKAYLYGEIQGQGSGPYTIVVDVLKTDSNDKLTSIEEKAENQEQIAAAVDRVARRVRSDMGEAERTIAKSDMPLKYEGTTSLKAMQAYEMGERALESGRIGDAIASYEKAREADPKFALAHLRLAWLYKAEMAEPAAAGEAKLAQATTGENASDKLKLLAEFCYEMNGTGDYSRAAGVLRQYKELYPKDEEGELALAQARLLRAEGHFPEALQAAQLAYGENPYSADAYAEAETAMLGMDRYQGVLQLNEQARRLGVVPRGSTMAAAYLAGDADLLAQRTAGARGLIAGVSGTGAAESYGNLADYGLYLDNEGRIAVGTAFWTVAAGSAADSGALVSAEPYLLAQGALDRALTKACSQATDFAKKAETLTVGPTAGFDAGMASALCGDKAGAERAIAALQQSFPKNAAVTGYYVPDLKAAMALAANDPKGALAALGSAGAYDEISLTPYLRGLTHLGTGEATLAVADFQSIIDHRGAAFIAGSNVYPMAQIGLARAYAAMGDKANSTTAYRKFEGLWQQADRGQGLLNEALAKGR